MILQRHAEKAPLFISSFRSSSNIKTRNTEPEHNNVKNNKKAEQNNSRRGKMVLLSDNRSDPAAAHGRSADSATFPDGTRRLRRPISLFLFFAGPAPLGRRRRRPTHASGLDTHAPISSPPPPPTPTNPTKTPLPSPPPAPNP